MKRSERTFFGRVLHDKKSNTLPTGIRFLKNHQRIVGIAVLLQIFAISTIFNYLGTSQASAASLTLTIPSSFSLDITPGAGGVFSKSSGQTINVKTDNDFGYTLSIKAKNNDNSNSLLNGSNKLSSISEQTTENNFKSDTKFNNTWGFLPSKFNGEDNTNFLPGPTTEESILEATDEANETGTDYNITLGAKVDNNTITGTYNNNFVFSVTTNGPKYDAIMQDWTGCASLPDDGNTTINLLDTRDNNIYKVAKLKDGKCWMVENLRLGDDKLQNRTLTSDNTDITAPTYDLTEQTPVDFNANKNYDADALYIDSAHPEYGGYYSWHTATAGTGTKSMSTDGQNATSSICPKGWKLPTGGSSSDFNDLVTAYGGNNSTGSTNLRATPVPGFVYSGRVWNDGEGLANQGSAGIYWSSTVLTASNAYYSNLYSSGANPANNIYKYRGLSVRCVTEPKKTMQTVDQWGGDVGDDEVVEAVDTRDGNTYTVSRLKDGKLWMTQNLRLINKEITPTDSDITSDSDPYTIPSSSTRGWNSTTYTNNKVYYGNNTNYGALYTWLTATAGTGTGSMSSGEAPSSICPKGWRLPTYAEMDTLTSAYSVSQAQTSPPNFGSSSWAGYCSQYGCPYPQGSAGYWWSSTAGSSGLAYALRSNSGNFDATDYSNGVGYSVRCVYAPKKITDLQYMQDWGDLSETEKTQVIDSMQEETTYTLIDKRDNSQYTIAKLKDGKVWMTQNLRIINKTITSTDSDMTSGSFAIPASSPAGGNSDFVSSDSGNDAAYYNNDQDDGAYYTWHTATAGTGRGSMAVNSATSSICPKGWKLPKGGEADSATSDFVNLVKAYGGDGNYHSSGQQSIISALMASPAPHFTYAGYVLSSDGTLSNRGSQGCYLSRKASKNTSYAYGLYFSSGGSLNGANNGTKRNGLSVRCVVGE